jgi:hypothetical protein
MEESADQVDRHGGISVDARRKVRAQEGEPVKNPNQYSGTDYRTALTQMVELCGLGDEVKTSTNQVAESLEVRPGIVGRLRTFSERVGGLVVRYGANYNPDGSLQGRSAHWRFIHDADWMIKRAEDIWGFETFDSHEIDKKMPKNGEPNVRSGGGAKTKNTMGTNDAQKTSPQDQTQIQAEVAKVRTAVAAPEALVEAINQYRNRAAFVDAEIAKFEAMGIEIDRSAIKMDIIDNYEFAIPLVELIEKLQGAIERMGTQDHRGFVTQANYNAVKNELTAKNEELQSVRNAHSNYMAQERVKAQAKDRRIKELEEELRKLATRHLSDAVKA